MKQFILIIFLVSCTFINAQSKKEIKDAKIKSKTEKVEITKKGKKISYTEVIEKYDSDGNVLELIEYDYEGDTKKHKTYQYNEKGKVIREAKLDALTKKEKSYIEYYYNDAGKLIKEIEYKSNKLHTTTEFTYDGEFKTMKKVTNSKNIVIEIKTYIYEK